MFAFDLFIAAEVFGDDGGSYGEGDEDQSHHDDYGEEDEAGFVVFGLEAVLHGAVD